MDTVLGVQPEKKFGKPKICLNIENLCEKSGLFSDISLHSRPKRAKNTPGNLFTDSTTGYGIQEYLNSIYGIKEKKNRVKRIGDWGDSQDFASSV